MDKVDPELQAVVRQKASQAQFAEVSLDLTDKCWNKCVDKIGSKPISEGGDSRTAACISNCVKNFIEMQQVLVAKFRGATPLFPLSFNLLHTVDTVRMRVSM
ncbi:hypothetical protein PTSG_02145 [Salpingoeca rosetta]|uniref:Mitochondrial import inner membrane translocase subunit n=1 Tax=Salpingoeca rosetta (strain ATCC 50818 / BSB-021) TaxID=946362 RepID=F2U1C2_SALR5|nr:uncharacterized protein PTSG_02145 [Salpingoeca rosetta]EGD81424.1 hypothetical protein PTSG_02145 [Salpingoeca rosetta]|eukprot:XP_004996628.1 hypothetical protein PTSG_02145 [Salpingoeca rosetta]